jgi:hypothetical protein
MPRYRPDKSRDHQAERNRYSWEPVLHVLEVQHRCSSNKHSLKLRFHYVGQLRSVEGSPSVESQERNHDAGLPQLISSHIESTFQIANEGQCRTRAVVSRKAAWFMQGVQKPEF